MYWHPLLPCSELLLDHYQRAEHYQHCDGLYHFLAIFYHPRFSMKNESVILWVPVSPARCSILGQNLESSGRESCKLPWSIIHRRNDRLLTSHWSLSQASVASLSASPQGPYCFRQPLTAMSLLSQSVPAFSRSYVSGAAADSRK